MMRVEDLARLQPPSREIPASVSWFVRLAPSEGLLFILIFTSLLSAFVAPNADWQSFLFLGGSASTAGRVVNAEERGWQEGKKTVYRVHFEFERDGRKETGDSHFVGDRPRIGDEVRIEWPQAFPRLARIEGARSGPIQRGALFILLPAWLALAWTRSAWVTASQRLRGMRDGVLLTAGPEPGLVDAATQKMLIQPKDIPYGIEVGFDGVWSLPSTSRLFRPVLMALVAVGSLGLLVRAFVSMAQSM